MNWQIAGFIALGIVLGIIVMILIIRLKQLEWLAAGEDGAFNRKYAGIRQVLAKIRSTQLVDFEDMHLLHYTTLDEQCEVTRRAVLDGQRWLFTKSLRGNAISLIKKGRTPTTIPCMYKPKVAYLQGVPNCDDWVLLVAVKIEDATICAYRHDQGTDYLLVWLSPKGHSYTSGSQAAMMARHLEATDAAMEGSPPKGASWEQAQVLVAP